jgi:hypothetical protein
MFVRHLRDGFIVAKSGIGEADDSTYQPQANQFGSMITYSYGWLSKLPAITG